jgi:hypothetical protein
VAEQRSLHNGRESVTGNLRAGSRGSGSSDLEGAARGLSRRPTKECFPSHIGESGWQGQ